MNHNKWCVTESKTEKNQFIKKAIYSEVEEQTTSTRGTELILLKQRTKKKFKHLSKKKKQKRIPHEHTKSTDASNNIS